MGAVEAAEEEARKFALEEGAKAGAGVARKIIADEARALRAEAVPEGEKYGAVAGRKAGAKACTFAVEEAVNAVSREKVTALRALFTEIATKAGTEAGARAAKIEAKKAVQQIAIEVAVKSVREKLLGMATKGQIKLSSAWRPTALVSVIAKRSDLSDLDKIRLAAKAKMEGNLADILPKKFQSKYNLGEDPLKGKLKFDAQDKTTVEANEEIDPAKKWSTVVFTELPDEKKRRESNSTKDNVNSLKKRFETANMKNNEAYVIM